MNEGYIAWGLGSAEKCAEQYRTGNEDQEVSIISI